MSIRIGIIVGEVSGDNIAASLIRALRSFYPDLVFEGILGPQLIKEGGKSFHAMERLSVMGLVEPLARLPELFRIRKQLIQHFIQNPPDVFIGVDAPDFNLGLEKTLKKHNIPTVHYVSPSVWAWRRGRIHTIQKAVDLMLTLFPFEAKFYQEHQVPVCFTGHPLADQIPIEIDTAGAKNSLLFAQKHSVIALLPGSRWGELNYLSETYLLTAKACYENNKNLQFVMPLVSQEHKLFCEKLHQTLAPEVPITIMVGDSHVALASADAVLVTSGTATLEVMLHKKPMVVAYRMHPLTYMIAKRLVKIPYISLPNLLANECLVPEYVQNAAHPDNLSKALLNCLSPAFNRSSLEKRFSELHQLLKRDASSMAACAIYKLISFNE